MNSQGTTYRINVDTNGNAVLPSLAQNADKADASLMKFTKDANGRLRDVNGRFVKTKQSSDQLGTSLAKVGNKAETGLGRMERKAVSSSKAISKLKGMVMGLGLTLSTGMMAASLVGTGAGFEKSMSNVQALSGATRTEMVGLKQAARDAGATTAYSAKQSADAMGYLAQAGFKAQQQVEALPATLNLAAAGGLDLARSADIATNILSQYRMKASETGVVVDQLALTQSSFNTNVEEMADAMNYWGPSAKAMKIGLSESNAVIGLLANNGLKGSLATRALGTSIVRLNKPTKQMQASINQLNLNLHDSKGQFVGVANMVEQLNRQTAGLNDKQKQAALSTIFGNEAIQEMNILLAEGADKIRYWTGELDNADGAAKRMANTKLDNLSGDFQILKSTTQEASLQIYDQMGPALRSVTKEATLFVRSMDTKQVGLTLRTTILQVRKGIVWLKENRKNIVALGKGLIILKAATLAYSQAGKIQAGVMMLGKTATLAKAMATGRATIAMRAFNMAVKANPLGLMLGVLTAVVSAVTLFRDRTKEATNAQRGLNQASLEAQLLKEESVGLVEDTKRDIRKAGLKTTSQRQLVSIRDNAIERKGQAEDIISDIKSNTLNSKEYKEYLELNNRYKSAIAAWEKGDYSVKGLTQRESLRMMTLKNSINDKPKSLTGFSLGQLNKIIKDNSLLIKKTNGLIKNESQPMLKVEPSVVDKTKASENIISGGASQRVINIKIDKFQDNVNFNMQGQINDLKDNMDEMRAMFNEMLMRVINSSNQTVNG